MARPRSVCPPEDELEQLGKDLIEWCNADKKNLFFAEFYSIEKHILRKHWKSIVQSNQFLPYYEEAQIILGRKLMSGIIKEGFAHRFIRLYFLDMKEDEDEVARAKNKAIDEKLNSLDQIIKDIREDMNVRTKSQPVRGISATPGSSVETK